MVGRGSSASPSLTNVNAEGFRSSAEIVSFPRHALPRLSDYARACAELIWSTFQASSMNAVCDRAAAETGAASADTFARILSGQTKSPDGYLMQCVLHVAAARRIAIPAALAVRIGAA